MQYSATTGVRGKDYGLVAICSGCGQLGRLWLGRDDDGRTVHLRHRVVDDGAEVCGIATVTSPLSGRAYRRPTSTSWRAEP